MQNGLDEQAARDARERLSVLRRQVAMVLVGKPALVDSLLVGLIAPGHILIEGVPGLAKTLAARSLAQASGLSYSRIQFTADLLPADITGTLVFIQNEARFVVRRGPVFAQVVVADEINRAPAKVQSALLEAMEEERVSIGTESHSLPHPFFVVATQNPIEQEGTYPLPEAELDRFLMKIKVSYPDEKEEESIVRGDDLRQGTRTLRPALSADDVLMMREAVSRMTVADEIVSYITRLTRSSRPEIARDAKDPRLRECAELLDYGASPRAAIALYRCSRARALMAGRSFVLPDDVKLSAPDVLRHRLILSYAAQSDGVKVEDILDRILACVELP
jgi:MoxR-like ATPase